MNNDEYIIIYNRIDSLLKNGDFSLDGSCLRYYNYYIFNGIEGCCGRYREMNISKFEDILDKRSVKYSDYRDIKYYVDYEIELEKLKDYSKFNKKDIINSISDFTIKLWSTHPFLEGNTRTISVFIRNYLRELGYKTDNELFLILFKYYRDSLALASYNDIFTSGDDSYLKSFYNKIIFNNIDGLKHIKKLVK